MLTVEEIKQFIDDDITSDKKKRAMKGQAYYEGRHDIKDFRLFYYDSHGDLVEDKTRNNAKICHPFFTELVDQAVQYILSGNDAFIRSDDSGLQAWMDKYFNDDENFIAELSELLTGCQAKGFEYMYAYKNEDNRTAFQCADSIGVVEVDAKDASDGKEHKIYWYKDKIEKGKKEINRIQVWDDKKVYYYVQEGNGAITLDKEKHINPKPHTLLKKDEDDKTYQDSFGFIPFFRLDNNKKQISALYPVKDLIDDYDIHASSLTNNLVDFDTPLHVVKGLDGIKMDELQQNLKTKKLIGLDEEGGVEIHTVDIPYQARKEKLELDEKGIYHFGMGLNTTGLKDTNATTNVAIKTAYSLLDLKCSKLEIRLKQILRKFIKVVLKEINDTQGTDYQMHQVYFNFEHEIMSNAQENAQIKLTEAQIRQAEINTVLGLASRLSNEVIMQLVCEQLDLDWNEIKGSILDPNEAESAVKEAQNALDNVPIEPANPEEVQEQAKEEAGVALNGAQTASLLNIISQYKAGTLTSDEAVGIISLSIGISEARAKKLLRLDAAGE